MKQCPILMYHWFREEGVPTESKSPQLEISPERFQRQMRYLKEEGFTSVSLQEVLSGPVDSVRKPIVITFDDGTLDFWEHARDTLKEAGFTATLFVVTDYVGKTSSWDKNLGEPERPLLNWEQIQTLHREGFEIGSHTHRHRPLIDLTDPEAVDELNLSRRRLTEKLGQAPAVFAYPRGFYSARHCEMVQEAGYEGACGVILRWRDLRGTDPFRLKRMTIKGTEDMNRFKWRVRAAHWVR